MVKVLTFLNFVIKWGSILIAIVICYLEWRKYKIEKREGEITSTKRRIIIAVMSLAFILVLSNVTQMFIETQIVKITEREEIKRKRTPPQFDVYLAKTDKGNRVIVFDAINYVPFEVTWILVTEENKVVDGIMLSEEKIFFNQDKKRIYYKIDIDENKVMNNYLELRVRYHSIYFAELNRPLELAGTITKKYKFMNGELHPIDNKK